MEILVAVLMGQILGFLLAGIFIICDILRQKWVDFHMQGKGGFGLKTYEKT